MHFVNCCQTMLTELTCPHCDAAEEYDLSEVYLDTWGNTFVLCCKCFGTITIPTEQVQIEDKGGGITTFEQALPVLKIGESVVVINKEHPWNRQIAIVNGVKHKFTRIELLGNKTWVPNEWIQRYEFNEPT